MNKQQIINCYIRIFKMIGERFINNEISYDTYIERTDKLTLAMDKKYRVAE